MLVHSWISTLLNKLSPEITEPWAMLNIWPASIVFSLCKSERLLQFSRSITGRKLFLGTNCISLKRLRLGNGGHFHAVSPTAVITLYYKTSRLKRHFQLTREGPHSFLNQLYPVHLILCARLWGEWDSQKFRYGFSHAVCIYHHGGSSEIHHDELRNLHFHCIKAHNEVVHANFLL